METSGKHYHKNYLQVAVCIAGWLLAAVLFGVHRSCWSFCESKISTRDSRGRSDTHVEICTEEYVIPTKVVNFNWDIPKLLPNLPSESQGEMIISKYKALEQSSTM